MTGKLRVFIPCLVVSVFTVLGGTAAAQPNVIPGTDVSLGILGSVNDVAHIGTFPNGTAALAMSTTSCNRGSVNVPWLAPMQENHPAIGFIIAREGTDRIEQVSSYSYVKHGFFALSSSQCTPCQNPSNGTFLGVGCSDTYGIGNNGDNFWLGPAEEVNPWLGDWEHIGSHFDKGQPPASPPFDTDGNRSPINPPNSLGNRVWVSDDEMDDAGYTYYYYGYYVIRGEPGAARKNNGASRRFTPTWTGSSWSISVPGSNAQVQGSILSRWAGAIVNSTGNGNDDGSVNIAHKTTDLGGGNFHYEYAIHNRDNFRGVKSFCIPVCPGATVSNVGFHDIDDNAGNDWTATVIQGAIIFETTDNPIRWNSFFNFWFDVDASPAKPNSLVMEQFDNGPGSDVLVLAGGTAPLGPIEGSNLGNSLAGYRGLAPQFRTCGDFATGGDASFLLYNARPLTTSLLVVGLSNNPTPLFGGTLVPVPIQRIVPLPTGAFGVRGFTVNGGGGPVDVFLQYLVADDDAPNGFAFSNAMGVTFDP